LHKTLSLSNKTYISRGDFIDLYYKIRQKGLEKVLSKLRLNNSSRIKSKWNEYGHSSDFWIIPEIRERWNLKATGDSNLEYEDYFVSKYLKGKRDLRLLSVGCGSGLRERKFAKHPEFSIIQGTDIADKIVEEARREAKAQGFDKIQYIAGDFLKLDFERGSFDVILFNSSLHHFDNISKLLSEKVKPLLKPDGYLVIFEFVGPNRLQWTKAQLKKMNELLKIIPERFKRRYQSNALKNNVYRPGLLRMQIIDPSEAIDSASIVPALHEHFKVVEEKKIGWDILHILLKDIAHNFLEKDEETREVLDYLFSEEDKFIEKTGTSNAIFGIYSLK